jgi:hypothetical protein
VELSNGFQPFAQAPLQLAGANAVDHPHRPVGAAQALLQRRLGLMHPQAAHIHGVGLGAHFSPLRPSITAGSH